ELTFITLRARNAKLTAQLEALPDSAWTQITLDRRGAYAKPEGNALAGFLRAPGSSASCAGFLLVAGNLAAGESSWFMSSRCAGAALGAVADVADGCPCGGVGS
ncbi:MAG: hypothetical protein LC713_05545, partial [Actinobacteria bacterium]|nr:hypothetical protein [Actinomycetota bacterium]